jgi:hypothetical protein
MNPEDPRSVLGQVIAQELAFLQEMGFQFDGVTEAFSDALGTRLTGTYTNTKANRIVRVDYIPKQSGPREVALTNIDLVVPESLDDFDYTTLNSMRVCVTVLSDIKGDLGARLAHHLRASENALRNQFMAVLAGQAWQSDHLDWGDMK